MAGTVQAERRSTNGSGPPGERFGLELARRRRMRLPEVAVGAALMVGFALAAVLWHMNSTRREPALVLAAAVERGEVIDASDVRVAYVAVGDGLSHLGDADRAVVVGRVAAADLPAGTLLTPGAVLSTLRVGRDEGVVGLALEPGQVPSVRLAPGDRVNVIAGPASNGNDASMSGVVVARHAVIYDSDDLGEGRVLVSLKLPEASADAVAAAAERGSVRLVLVGR